MFCSRCGSEIHESDSFCQHCGAAICVAIVKPSAEKKPQEKKQYTELGVLIGALSLTLAIIALVLACFTKVSMILACTSFMGGLLTILDSQNKKARCGTAVAGMICSIVAFAVGFFGIFLNV